MAFARRLSAGLLMGAALALPGCVPAPEPAVAPASAAAPAPGFVQSVRPGEVDLWRGMNDRGLTLDVRALEDWNDPLGHLDGAMQIPSAELEARLSELAAYRDRPVLVYDRDGTRAQAAAQFLSRTGYRDVSWVEGGLQAYRAWLQSR